MSNFSVGPDTIIPDIQRLLAESYVIEEGGRNILPIIKEILQNANDAGATELEVRFHRRGFARSDVGNELLADPAILCLNNGPFKERDSYALRSMSVTSKTGNSNAIGRFGLGKKAVFHLAEVFFALGQAPGEALIPLCINPWTDPDTGRDIFDREWNAFEEADRGRVEALVDARWRDARSWLALWLPIRVKRDRGAPIRPWYPDIATLAEGFFEHPAAVASLLPQLSTLQRVRFSGWTMPGGTLERTLEIHRVEGNGLSLPAPGMEGEPRRVRVTWRSGEAEGELLAVLKDFREPSDAVLQRLQANPHWPRRLTKETGYVNEPEKAVCHGGVTIVREPATGEPREDSKWAWAVFLPLAEHELRVEGPWRWRLWLHGYFFPDSGRQRPIENEKPLPTSEDGLADDTIRAYWNAHVRDKATLPCLIPALAAALEGVEVAHAETLVRAVSEIAPLQGCATAFGRDHSLIFGPEGDALTACRLVPAASRLVAMPRPRPTEWQMARTLLSALQKAVSDVEILWAEAPRLGARAPAALSGQDWTSLVSSEEVAKTFIEPEAVEYVARCIETLGEERPRVARAMMRKGLSLQTPRKMEPEAWRTVVSYLPGKCLFLPITRDELLELLKLDTGILVLQPEFDRGAKHDPRLDRDDVATLLAWADQRIRQGRDSAMVRRLIREVVSAYGLFNALRDERLAQLPFIPVQSATREGGLYIGFADFADALRQRCVFVGREVFRQVLKELHRALGGRLEDVLLVHDAEWIDVLQRYQSGVPTLSLSTVLDLVASQPRLPAEREERMPLLKWILDQSPPKDAQDAAKAHRAVTALLYGEPGSQARSPLALLPSGHEGVQELLLAAIASFGWESRSIPRSVGLKPEWVQTLRIEYVGERDLIGWLRERSKDGGAELLAALSAEQKRLLRKLLADHKDETAWKWLAIHPTNLGLRSLDAHVFRRGAREGWAVPDALRAQVALLVDDADPQCANWALATVGEWSPAAQLEYCVRSAEPSRLWREALSGLAACANDASDTLREEVLRVPWLPHPEGGAVAPASVLLVPDAVERSLQALDGVRLDGLITEVRLPPEVTTHPGFAPLRTWINGDGEPWPERLVISLERGGLPKLIPDALDGASALDGLLEARSLEKHAELRLFRAVRAESHGEWTKDLRAECAHLLTGEVRAEDFVTLLSALSREPGGRAPWRDYLRAAASGAAFSSEILPRLQLPNQEGAFVGPETLARSAASIAPRHLLAPDAAEALADAGWFERFPEEDEPEPTDEEALAGSRHFGAWLDDWRQLVREPGLLSALLVLLGKEAPLKAWEWAERVDGTHRPAYVLSELLGPGTEVRARWISEVKYSVRFVRPGHRMKVQSLTSGWFDADLVAESPERLTVFVGHLPKLREAHRKPQPLKLTFAPEYLGADMAPDVVRRSITLFLEQVAGTKGTATTYLSKLLDHPGEERIEIVRSKIKRDLPGLLHGFRRGAPRALLEALSHFDTADLERDEAASQLARLPEDSSGSERSMRRTQLEQCERAVEEARKALEGFVFGDGPEPEAVRAHLLKVLRQRIAEYQYLPEQVLFELAQNADDALAQLDGAATSHRLRVRCDEAERRVDLSHRGRRINDTLGKRREDPLYGQYNRDLLNLLKLNVSDKDPESNTGHFGIGFKSVYLLTDEAPEVVSGSLAFRIRACLLPEAWRPPTELRDEGDAGGTAFRLRVRDAELYRKATAQFRGYGGLLCVFSRAIRELSWQESPGATQHMAWRPRELEAGMLEIGDLQVSLAGGEAGRRRVLVLRRPGKERIAVVLALSGRGVERFPRDVPTIWCTAPTRVLWDLGLLVNASFEVDVGRTNLANDNRENDRIFGLVGECVRDGLSRLWKRAAEDWGTLAADLGVPRDAGDGAYELWESLFNVLSEARRAHPSAEHITRGYARFLREAGVAALPSRLPGAWRRCVAPRDVRWILTEELDQRHDPPRFLWEAFSCWPWVKERFPPGKVVSARAGELLALQESPSARSRLGLRELLDAALARGVLEPGPASELDVLRSLGEAGALPATLIAEQRDWAKAALFLTEDGRGQPAQKLLLSPAPEVNDAFEGTDDWEDVEDELRRAAFAPPSALLSRQYQAKGTLRFFRFARQKLDADSRQLAHWARQASSPEARHAVLTYLLHGRLRTELAKLLREEGNLPWCRTAEELAPLAQAASLSYPLLTAILFETTVIGWMAASIQQQVSLPFFEEDAEDDDAPGAPFAPPLFDSRRIAEAISRWWRDHGPASLSEYERKLYPAGWSRPEFKASLAEEAGPPRSRDAWMTLLALGACHRFGRQTPDQHRHFLELLRGQGSGPWWTTLIAEQSSPQEWMRILDEWMAKSVENETYSLWLGLFPTLYCFSRHLSVYARLILNVARVAGEGPFDLRAYLRPRSHPALSGSDLDAPPIARALGQGASFVLRELARLGLIEPRGELETLCYVPYSRTRELVGCLGGASTLQFQEWPDRSRVLADWSRDNLVDGDPTFDRCYDLPLLTLYGLCGTDATGIAKRVGLDP